MGAQRPGSVVRHHFAVLAGGRGSAGPARGAAALADRWRDAGGRGGRGVSGVAGGRRISRDPAVFGAFLLLQLGCAGWALGSIAQRKTTARAHPFVSGAVQQLATGMVYAIPALIHPRADAWSARGIGAVIYLMIFGSIIGYSAYVFAMDRLPVAIASIYTYVNPMVAVLLGWAVYHEPLGWREAIGMS